MSYYRKKNTVQYKHRSSTINYYYNKFGYSKTHFFILNNFIKFYLSNKYICIHRILLFKLKRDIPQDEMSKLLSSLMSVWRNLIGHLFHSLTLVYVHLNMQ